MAETRVIIPYAPRDIFQNYHARKERFAAIVAHRRAGKTVSTINDLIRRTLTCPLESPRTAYIAPFYKQAKAVAWDYTKRFGLVIPGSTKNESELFINFPNGGQLRLYGADNPDALRGIYLDEVILDEYGDMNPRMFSEVIRPALTDRRGGATFIGTPKGKNDFYHLCERARKSPDWFFSSLKASETRIVSPKEIEQVKQEMTEEQFLQEFECSFEASILGAYFSRELHKTREEGRIGDFGYNPNYPVSTAWDVGYSDDTAIWFYQVYNDAVHVIDYYYNNQEAPQHYSDVVLKKGYTYDRHFVPIDTKQKQMAAHGRSTFEQLALELGYGNLRIVKKETRQNGINSARVMLSKTYFNEEACKEGLEALTQYRREWDAERKCFRDNPKHDWTSHAADAFRMLAISYQEEYKEPIKPKPKAIDYDFGIETDDDWKLN